MLRVLYFYYIQNVRVEFFVSYMYIGGSIIYMYLYVHVYVHFSLYIPSRMITITTLLVHYVYSDGIFFFSRLDVS